MDDFFEGIAELCFWLFTPWGIILLILVVMLILWLCGVM